MGSGRHDQRMRTFTGAALYLVTSESCSRGRSTVEIVREGLAAGVRLIQLREKTLAPRELLPLAREVRSLTSDANALLIINDHLDVALAVQADGVHLGRTDLPVNAARLAAPDLIIGASTHSVEDVNDAQKQGASYINIGPLFATDTKTTSTAPLGLEGLRRMAEAASVPFTVMGGIKKDHIRELTLEGARTIAVVTAVTAADDPQSAARELLEELNNRRKGGEGR